jgi:hypothetical protein
MDGPTTIDVPPDLTVSTSGSMTLTSSPAPVASPAAAPAPAAGSAPVAVAGSAPAVTADPADITARPKRSTLQSLAQPADSGTFTPFSADNYGAPPTVEPAQPAASDAIAPFSADSFGTTTDAAHPRAPSDWIAKSRGEPHAPTNEFPVRRSDSSADIVAVPVRANETRRMPRLFLIGGGVAAVAIVLFLVLGRGSSTSATPAAHTAEGSPVAGSNAPANAAAPGDDEHDPTSSMQLPSHGNAAKSGAAAPATASVGSAGSATPETTETANPSDGEPTAAAPPPPLKHHPTLGGKQVVLEYDTPTHEAPKPATTPKEDSAAVEKARTAYAQGNQRLFAGDAAGALRFYQQSLADYPGYVAGYRGLGLAFAQQGDKAKALQAFRTYLSSVPGAKDAALIRKRLTTLSH